MRTASAGKKLSLLEDHQLRVACAEDHLPPRPLSPDILDAMIASARTSAMMGMIPDLACWLPDVIPNFTLLVPGLESTA